MDKPLIKHLKLLLVAVLLTFCAVTAYADKTVADFIAMQKSIAKTCMRKVI